MRHLPVTFPRYAFPRDAFRRAGRTCFVALLAMTSLLLRLADGAEADAAAIRFAGQLCELVLSEVSDRTLRVQVLPLDEHGRAHAPAPSGALVPFVAVEKLRIRTLTTRAQEARIGELRVTLSAAPLTVSVQRSDGTPVQQLVFNEAADGEPGVSFRTTAPVLGLGEGARQFDRRGARYEMEPSWGVRQPPLRGSIVPSPFVIGSEGWALFVHQPEGEFDLRESTARFVPRRRADEAGISVDVFVINVDEPSDALTEYARLTGHAVMPPKWALGYMQSHRTLAGPEQPLEIARTFRNRNLPCDAVIYLGTGYCPSGWNTGHGSLEFNPKVFDRPAEQIAALRALNIRVALHVNGAPDGLFGRAIDERSNVPQHIGNYWSRHRATFALGVDGWWPDDGDELVLDARVMRHRLYYEGALHDRPNVRPWSLHRTGYAGVQRYGGWIWSGDTDSRWEILADQIAVGLNHGLSLTPFWGSDTGGFFPTAELTGELYVRWFQFSAFCSSFRSHGRTWHLRLPWGWNTGEFGPKEYPDERHSAASELRNAEVEPICRKYLELRYRLLPYNYSLAREACDTGLPMMRALWLHHGNDAEATAIGDEYLWGRDLLVAPVVTPGATTRRVYLPDGGWHDWWTGEKFVGGRWIERAVDLATLPLFARTGAIVPLDPVRQHTAEVVTEPTTLHVFPGADGGFTLYDDDGESLGYRDGSDPKTVWIRFRWEDATRTLTAERDARMPRWTGGERVFEVRVMTDRDAPQTQPHRVVFRGEPMSIGL
jgi:alpha-glucosidase (family GH31 glycosyl hydrolase)